MNKITTAERERIIARATVLVRLEHGIGPVLNSGFVAKQLKSEFGISNDRAYRAVAAAARRLRRPKRGTA
jgi:diaminopimelate decarboxylase